MCGKFVMLQEYVAMEHNWFTQAEAQLKRIQTLRT